MKTLTNYLCIALILFLPFCAMTDDVVILGLVKGTHYLKVVVNADGSVTHTRLAVSGGGTPTNPPSGPSDPVPTEPKSQLAKDLRKILPKNDNDHAVARAHLFDELANLLEDGSLEVGDVGVAVKSGIRALNRRLKTRSKNRDAWKPIDAKISAAVDKAVQEKGLSPKTIAGVYKEVAVGLNVTSDIEAIDIVAIIQIVKAIIELLRDLGIIGK